MKLHQSLVICASLAIAALATPAAAELWIVRDHPGGECTIVNEKPANDQAIIVGGAHSVFQTREEAENVLSILCDED
jgi:hypothetical protein